MQTILTGTGTEDITQPTLNYAAQLLPHLRSTRPGDHKHAASSVPMPTSRSRSAPEREEKAGLGQITFPMRIICFGSSAPTASPLRVWTHDLFFMADQAKPAPREVQGAQPVLVMGITTLFFTGPLLYQCTIHLCFASLYKIKNVSKNGGKSMSKATEPKKSPLSIGRLKLQSFRLYLLATGY